MKLSTATKITINTILVNLILSAFKFTAGIYAHSQAMISDAIHSASDVFSSLVVIAGIYLSQKESDKNHPYGHERFECVGAIILAAILAATGLAIGGNALSSLLNNSAHSIETPGIFALTASIISILVKEAMYWYTRYYAIKLDLSALMAEAWHHRSDAFSSIGALIGIAAARMGFPFCDAAASFIISIFIVKAAYDIFKDAIDKMVDHSCDESTESALKQCILSHQNVLQIDFFQTRIFGNKIYVDLEISVNAAQSLIEAHHLAEKIHQSIELEFPQVKHIMIHVNPDDATNGCQNER